MLEQDAAGQLTSADAETLQLHLAQCAACGRHAALLARIDRALGSIEPVPAPASLRPRVYRALEPLMDTSAFPWKKWMFRLAFAPAFAVVLWLVFAVDSTWALWYEGLKSTRDMDVTAVMASLLVLIDRTPPITLAILFGGIILLLVYLREAFFTK